MAEVKGGVYTSSWLQHHKPPALARPGTTFPPLATSLPHLRLGAALDSTRCRFLSEPNLGPEPEDIAEQELEQVDEDYLFEFDIGSPASSDGEEEEEVKVVNEAQEVGDGEVTGENRWRRSSCCSDSSSSCSSSRSRRSSGLYEPDSLTAFSSKSSGLESDRRSSQGEVEVQHLSLGPEDWRSGAWREEPPPSTPSTPSTPRQAASPCALGPLVSPDSCLDEENMLEDQDLCMECCVREAVEEELQEAEGGDTQEDLEEVTAPALEKERIAPALEEMPALTLDNTVTAPAVEEEEMTALALDNTVTARAIEEEEVANPALDNTVAAPALEEDEVAVSANLTITQGKLASMLAKLEADKPYPRPGRVSLASSSPGTRREGEERPRLRKCSSLRTSKTPPTTPGGRKAVRFADILGLDLSEVKVFNDELPRVPKSAFEDLDLDPSEYQVTSPLPRLALPALAPSTTSLVPMFSQPGAATDFPIRVARDKVCLETALVEGQDCVSGLVRVANLSFQKAVTVRWTVTDWATVQEQPAQYVTSQGDTDQFSFSVRCGRLEVGGRLQLCLKFSCSGEHWDSNRGDNYVFQVFPSPSTAPALRRNQPLGMASRPLAMPGRALSQASGMARGSLYGLAGRGRGQLQASPVLGASPDLTMPGQSSQALAMGRVQGLASRGRGHLQASPVWGASPSQHDDPWQKYM